MGGGEVEYTVHFMLHEGAFFHLEDDAARLQAFDIVPGVFGNVDSQTAFSLAQGDTLDKLALVVVSVYADTPLQQDEGLIFGDVMVDGDNGAHLQGIEETVTLVIEALVKVVVLAQAGRGFGLLYHFVNQLVVNNLHGSDNNYNIPFVEGSS